MSTSLRSLVEHGWVNRYLWSLSECRRGWCCSRCRCMEDACLRQKFQVTRRQQGWHQARCGAAVQRRRLTRSSTCLQRSARPVWALPTCCLRHCWTAEPSPGTRLSSAASIKSTWSTSASTTSQTSSYNNNNNNNNVSDVFPTERNIGQLFLLLPREGVHVFIGAS